MLVSISRKIALTHSTLAALLIVNGIFATLANDYGRAHPAPETAKFLWITWITISSGVVTALLGGSHLHKVACGGLARQQSKFAEVADTLDLSNRSASPRKDEFGKCAIEFDRFMRRIDETIRAVRLSTETVAVATRQIAAGNLDLSSRTEQQAASLEETAATLRQLTIAISHNANNARQAFELADSAKRIASQGSNRSWSRALIPSKQVHHRSQLAERFGLPKSQVSRILANFRDAGWLEQEPSSRSYVVGLSAYVFGA